MIGQTSSSQVSRRAQCDPRDCWDSISAQAAAIGRELAAQPTVTGLPNAGTASRAYTAEPPFRPGEHRTEAGAAFDGGSMEPGGGDWRLAVSALIHALPGIGERL
jgi:hypothetical protein